MRKYSLANRARASSAQKQRAYERASERTKERAHDAKQFARCWVERANSGARELASSDSDNGAPLQR